MSLDDFYSWRRAKFHKEKPKPEPEPSEFGLVPSEPMKVEEHDPASTTIIERLYARLGKRS
jgi:hypothetical protein